MKLLQLFVAIAVALITLPASAADYPAPKEASFVARDFRFHTGEVMPEIRLHYRTVGEPTGQAVLILHGTAGSGANILNQAFAGELFGAGQPLDATKHFIILPDALGTGQSSKPSDGLRTKFPKYNYDDMVLAQYRLVTEGLGISHLRLVIGNSMGGMQTWLWGTNYPTFMDALVPMASQPTEMSSRNWMMRRMIIDAIRNDPDWNNGNYEKNPTQWAVTAPYGFLQTENVVQIQAMAPSREAGDALYRKLLEEAKKRDANDTLWGIEAVMDYNPTPHLDKIKARLMAINSGDDEANPARLASTAREIARIPNARYVLIPASEETHGHFTHLRAAFWKAHVAEFMKELPPQM